MTPLRSQRARQYSVSLTAHDAVTLETVDVPTPGEGELLLELVAAPINPAEVLMLEGAYGYRETVPALPRDLGIEGVGRVVGGAVDTVPLGTLVALIGASGIIGDHTVIPAEAALRVPDDIDPETFAVSFVNVQSVLLMLSEWGELRNGDWVVQNAANSGYGRIFDRVATSRGLNVVNVVRSGRARDEIDGVVGGPVVIDGDDLERVVLEATGGIAPRVAVDAVGGAATGRLASSLAAGGRVVVYGLLSGEPSVVDTRLTVFHGITVEGFWMPRSIARASSDVLAGLAEQAMDVLRAGDIVIPIAHRYSLDDISTAVARAAQGGRGGKVLVVR